MTSATVVGTAPRHGLVFPPGHKHLTHVHIIYPGGMVKLFWAWLFM